MKKRRKTDKVLGTSAGRQYNADVSRFVVATVAWAMLTTSPRVERPTPFAVGETLTYDVSWSTALSAGTVVSTVKEKKASFDSTAFYIVAEGRPAPLLSKLYTFYYKVDTLLDVYTLLAQRGSVYSEEGQRHRFGATLFDRMRNRASFEHTTTTVVKSEFAVQPGAQDLLSALYAVRTMPLKAGDRIAVPVSDGGTNYRVQMAVGTPEPVQVPLGSSSAWKVTLVITDAASQQVGRNVAVWLSTDSRRLPLKAQAELPVGAFVLGLRDVK